MNDAQQKIVTLVDQIIPHGLALINPRGQILFANQLLQNMMGVDLHGFGLNNFIRHPDLLDHIAAAAKGKKQTLDYERKAQTEQQFHLQLLPFEGDIFVIVEEITATKNIDQMRTDFIANISHELRSPLTTLSGFIETLLDGAQDDKESREQFLCIMDDEAKRMQRLVNGLLSLARMESTQADYHMTIDLVPLISTIIDSFAARSAKQKMSFHFNPPPYPFQLVGDRDELTELFHNLFDNALKYGKSDQGIEVRLQTHENHIHIEVANWGEQIAAHHIPRLTERFYRVDRARTSTQGGTGLGLAIVKHIVHRHHGQLQIRSDIRGKTTIEINFPYKTAT